MAATQSSYSPSLVQRRLSPDIYNLRVRAPYVDYEPLPHAHPEPQSRHRSPESDTANSRWKTLISSYGSRHVHDVADFSLWDEESQNFRQPTRKEMHWILGFYHANEVMFNYPVIKILTDVVPDPLPLTVACVAVRFMPSTTEIRHPLVNTAYATPRIPDPMSFLAPRWASPTQSQIKEIITVLAESADIKAITWIGPWCYVEIRKNERVYGRHSLPGYVAGKTTTYHHSETEFWAGAENRALSRAISPHGSATGSSLQDRTNYLNHGTGVLQPGVRLSNSLNSTDDTTPSQEPSTTCGVCLQSRQGEVVITAANHGVRGCDDVYHPSTQQGPKIGTIVERWPAQDIAMFKLIDTVQFSNTEYFEATAPTQLLRSNQLADGAWCSADGMSTGLVFFQCVGVRATDINLVASSRTRIETLEFRTERVFNVFGPVGSEPAIAGICGAPIVEEGSSPQGLQGGGIYGFFRFGNTEMAISPVLDDIIDAGWELP